MHPLRVYQYGIWQISHDCKGAAVETGALPGEGQRAEYDATAPSLSRASPQSSALGPESRPACRS